jgi:hypothetical protein
MVAADTLSFFVLFTGLDPLQALSLSTISAKHCRSIPVRSLDQVHMVLYCTIGTDYINNFYQHNTPFGHYDALILKLVFKPLMDDSFELHRRIQILTQNVQFAKL